MLQAALAKRETLIHSFAADDTNSFRIFNGEADGRSGLTVDRYGSLILVESFRTPLPEFELSQIEAFFASADPSHTVIYNDRSNGELRIANPLSQALLGEAMLPREAREFGVAYRVQGRHFAHASLFDLELRALRRQVMKEAIGKTVLNVFSYTCSAGIAAAKSGASFVVNVDADEYALSIGKESARINSLPVRPRFLKSDAFAAMRQFAGIGQAERVRGKRMPPFPKVEPRQFDLVLLDPPEYGKSAFGVINSLIDYASVFKPAILCVAPAGSLICTHRVRELGRDAWAEQLSRSATKAGRPIKDLIWIDTDTDFVDSNHPEKLKTALLRF
jgi:23S rRNA (cytosine1962-C5)-methyltransferase